MELKAIVVALLVSFSFQLEAQDGPVTDEERVILNVLERLDKVPYPKVAKQDIRTGTCFLSVSWQGQWKLKVLNSLGPAFDKELLNILESSDAQTNQMQPLYFPVTFVAGGVEYARVQKPEEVLSETTIAGLPAYKSKVSKEKLIKDYSKQYRQGNYSKALRILDELILLDPYRVSYRTDRMKIYLLLGSAAMGCDDYIILKEVLQFQGVAEPPCTVSESN